MPSNPGVQTPGYFQNVPAGHRVFKLHKYWNAPSSLRFGATKFLLLSRAAP
jgi:hypothetical protein